MASRLLTSSLRASGSIVRPGGSAILPRIAHRAISSTPQSKQQPPAEKAAEIINSMPSSSNLITKTGSVVLGTGLLAAAISQELYVVNEETVVLVGFVAIFSYLAKTLRGPYRDWAQGHIDKIRGVLQSARDQHTSAVRERITSVEAMKEVVPLTTQLFELSKETAKLEAANFELRQKVALAAEVKAVLDSWVRFEQGQKASEQEQLVKSIIDKVMKNVNDERVQKEILSGAVAEIEQMVKSKAI